MSDGADFTSDNASGIAPRLMEAIAQANAGTARAYGEDPWTEGLDPAFSDLFETPVRVFPVFTGSAANALSLAALTPPYGAVFCHEGAHIAVDECGAPEFYTGGAKLVTVSGHAGKVDPSALEAALAAMPKGVMHHNQPAALSLTQVTECGTLYTIAEVEALTKTATANGLRVHMDGARFANAVAALGCAPADLTWRAGVDVLSFGGTKNGAFAAEAVVFFDPALAEAHIYRQKRAGQVSSKARFISTQLLALLKDGYWLSLAAHANAMAARLAKGATALGCRLAYAREANEVFLEITRAQAKALYTDGHQFHPWTGGGDRTVCRFVASFSTTEDEVRLLLESLKRAGA